jgi:hypothetical protein
MLKVMRQQIASGNFDLTALRPGIASARADKRGAKYETALQYVERTWGRTSLEYKGPNQTGFAAVAGRLHVLKNTVVTFREVDTGTQQTYTFSVASASNNAGGEITAAIAFGPTSHTVKAIVFELQAKVTFGDAFAGRSQNDVGANEHLTLGFDSVPAGITAAQAGDPVWTIHGAIPANADVARQLKGKLQRAAADTSAPLRDGNAFFFAPWATDPDNPLNPRPSKRTSTATLRLVIQNGPSKDLYVERSFTVHTPVARMVATPPYRHVQGRPSAGFIGDILFDPKNVSFRYIRFQEGRGTMVTKQTGFLGPQDMRLGSPPRQLPPSPSGYFAWEGARVHQHTPAWVDIGTGDAANGCRLNGSDDVYSGANMHWPARYNATHGALFGRETNVPSELRWPIFWRYRAEDLAQGVLGQQVVHHATMDASGKVTMAKAGASVSCNLSDPSVA